MIIVLVLNVLLAGLACFAVIGGLAWSITSERTVPLHRRPRRAARRRGTTATPVPAEVGA